MGKKNDENNERLYEIMGKKKNDETLDFIPTSYQFTKENNELLEKISDAAAIILAEKNKVIIHPPEVLNTIACAYVQSMFKILEEQRKSENVNEIKLDFYGLFDFGISNSESEEGEKDGNIYPYAETGKRLKNLVKNDTTTEEEND